MDPFFESDLIRVVAVLNALKASGLEVSLDVLVFVAIARQAGRIEWEGDNPSQADIAAHLGLTKGTASKVVTKLVKAKLIRSVTKDGFRRLDLTLKGERAVKRVLSAFLGKKVEEFGI